MFQFERNGKLGEEEAKLDVALAVAPCIEGLLDLDSQFREKHRIVKSLYWTPYIIERGENILRVDCMSGNSFTIVDWLIMPSGKSGNKVIISRYKDERRFYEELSEVVDMLLNTRE
jgi:hypothetical protein